MPDASIPHDPQFAPYLSIVCALGPQQRDEKWLRQTRLFLATLVAQAARHALPIEIVLADGGPADAPLVQSLGAVAANDFAAVRVLDLSQMGWRGERYAQNCAIRRARGQFVLATGVEVLLGDALFAHLATRPLSPRSFYYGFRIDTVPTDLNEGSDLSAVERACRQGAYSAGPSISKVACDGSEIATDADWQGLLTQAAADAKLDLQILPISYSTGNFLLMARPDWFEVGGFPEWNVADRHFDRIVMGQAHYRGWTKIVFPPSLHYFSASRLRELDLADDLYVDAEGDPRIRVESPAIRPFGDYYVISVLHRLKCIFDESPSLLPARIGANGPDWGLPGLNLPESQPLSTAQIQPA